MALDLDQLVQLPTTAQFAHPLDATTILPICLGDTTNPAIVDPADPNGGFTPCILIDTERLIYAVNAFPAVATQPKLFWKGKPQDPSIAIWRPTDTVEGWTGATLTFTLRGVRDGPLAVRFGGTVDASGNPITNPIFALYHLLTLYAGWTLDFFDRAACMQSAQDLAALGYEPFVFCFKEVRTIRDWLMELLPMFHCDFTETGAGQLAIIFDRTLSTLPVYPDFHVTSEVIEDHGAPMNAIQRRIEADDVVNQVTLHGRFNWAENDTTADYTWDNLVSQAAYQAAYPTEFTFRAMYTLNHALAWLESFSMRHAYEPTLITFTITSLRALTLITPRIITVEWPLWGWVKHLLKIRRTSISFADRSVTLECIDCQRELDETVNVESYLPTLRFRQLSRIFEWVPGEVGPGGSLIDAPDNPRNEAANGDFSGGDTGQWDLYHGSAERRWEIVDDPDGAYTGRFYARSTGLVPGNASIYTLRNRIDAGQWVFESAWFRQEDSSADGAPQSIIYFYDFNDSFLDAFLGNPIMPTETYLESVAFGQAPAGAYYYRPGIRFESDPSTGQWRADHVFSVSGSLHEILTARQGDVTSRNFIINGDFELGTVLWQPNGGWVVTNDPRADAHSGIWKAVHLPTGAVEGDRLNSLTKISVATGQTFTLQCYVITLGNTNGTGQLGVTWVDGQGNLLGENATPGASGSIPSWTLARGVMPVPEGAVYALIWAGVTGHSNADSFWLIDDMLLSVS